jgi:hypothetical protein
MKRGFEVYACSDPLDLHVVMEGNFRAHAHYHHGAAPTTVVLRCRGCLGQGAGPLESLPDGRQRVEATIHHEDYCWYMSELRRKGAWYGQITFDVSGGSA